MSIRRVTSTLNDARYVRALEKELGELRRDVSSMLTRVKEVEGRPRPVKAPPILIPNIPASFAATSTAAGSGCNVVATFQPVTFSTTGKYIYIDRHDLQGRKAGGSSWAAETGAGVRRWNQVAGSDDGTIQIAGASLDTVDERLMLSTDGGATWEEQIIAGDEASRWPSVAASADGSVLAGMSGDAIPYISTDFGATWAARKPLSSPNISFLALSADGTTLAVMSTSSGQTKIFYSTDTGVTWSQVTVDPAGTRMNMVNLSADGQTIVIASTKGLHYSSNGGATWTLRTVNPDSYSAACSADGQTIVFTGEVTDAEGMSVPHLFASYDAGGSWADLGGSRDMANISGDGRTLLSILTDPYVMQLSVDGGATWTTLTESDYGWYLSDISYDGSRVLAAIYGGNIYSGGAAADDPWRSLTSGDGLAGSIAYWPLPLGETWQFRIRAVSVQGVAGAWSDPFNLTLAS